MLFQFIYYHDKFASSPEYLKQRSIKSMDVYEYEHKGLKNWINYFYFTLFYLVHDVSPKVRNFQKRRKAYLLITLYRSGSTLTGEMFNRNKKFLYYFEVIFERFSKRRFIILFYFSRWQFLVTTKPQGKKSKCWMSHSIVFRRSQKSSKKTRRQKPRQPKIVSMRESACSSLVQDFVRYLFGSECQGIKTYSIIIIFILPN